MKPEKIVLAGLMLILISVIVPHMMLSAAINATWMYSLYAEISVIFTVLFWIGIVVIVVGIAKLMRN